MTRIYKFPLRHMTNQVMAGRVLKIDFQGGELMAWVQVEVGAPDQVLVVVPTGMEFDPTNLEHVGTAVSDALVFHVFWDRAR